MKILFVDNSTELQLNWIDPLRKRGWGVVRARSAEDAARMIILHGDGLEAIAVTEKFVPWAEKQGVPFVVLISHWNQNEVIKHQNSPHSAVSYLPFSRGCEEIYALFEARHASIQVSKKTGTDGLSLEEYSGILSRPEKTRTTSGLQLSASEIVLGGNAALPEVEEINIFEPAQLDEVRTVLLEGTKLDYERATITGSKEPGEDEYTSEIASVDEFIDNIAQMTRLEIPQLNTRRVEIPEEEPAMTRLEIPRLVTRLEIPLPPPSPKSVPVSNQFSIDPSPSSQVSDVGTLKSYLALREQDVAVLGGQVRSSQERIQQLEALLKVEKVRSAELSHIVSRQESQLKTYDQDKQVEFEVLEKHIEDMGSQLKDRTDKVRTIEAKLRLTVDEVNKVKERVRVDIRRIRVREKELEGQLEILKKDSSALLQSRDEKIIELKRKLDLLEFNMELVQEQYSKERKTSDDLKSRLKDAASVMKQAGGLLEQ
ncbi:MAG: hypothetical protein H7333_10500 [Bdellovibrionales bacterium]|nr:hypothetical protein [Oligoflexia bacterium]